MFSTTKVVNDLKVRTTTETECEEAMKKLLIRHAERLAKKPGCSAYENMGA